MNVINSVLSVIFASLEVHIQLLSFSKLNNNIKIDNKFKYFISVLFGGFIVVLNSHLNNTILRPIISLIVMLIIALFIFRKSISITAINLLLTYAITIIYEIIYSVIVSNFIDSVGFEDHLILKILFSLIVMVSVYLTCSLKFIINSKNKYFKKLETTKFDIIFSISILILLIFIDFVNFYSNNIRIIIYNLVIILCIIFIIIYAIYNHMKAIKELDKIDSLLSFLTKYEKIMDRDSILRHEMLNNLLILNSIEDKNSKEFDDIIKELIQAYSNNNGIKMKNIYKLPPGIKGILYIKLNGLEEEDYKINIRIDKDSNLNKIKKKDYRILCKIMTIVLDNAVEAAKKTKEKIINIDIYNENKKCIILVENTFDKKVDLQKIDNKRYSTKGNNRGFGLYIVKSLLEGNKRIELFREINNNIFSTKIIIK